MTERESTAFPSGESGREQSQDPTTVLSNGMTVERVVTLYYPFLPSGQMGYRATSDELAASQNAYIHARRAAMLGGVDGVIFYAVGQPFISGLSKGLRSIVGAAPPKARTGGYLAQHWRGHLASYLLFAYFRGLWEYGGMLHRSWLKLPGTPMGVEAATRASAFSPHGSASGKEGEDGVVSKPPVTIVSRSNVDLRQKTKKEEGDEGEGTFVEPPPFWVDDDVHSRNDVSQPIAHLERVDDESLHRSGRSGRGEAVVVDRDESDLRPRLDRSRWDHEAVAANDDENENVNGSRKSTRGGDGRYFSNRGGGGLDESYSSSRNDDVDEDGGEAVRPPSPRRRYFRDGHSHPRASRAHEEPTFRADTSDPPMMHDQRIHPRRSSRSSPYGDEPPPFKVEKPVFGTGGSSGP